MHSLILRWEAPAIPTPVIPTTVISIFFTDCTSTVSQYFGGLCSAARGDLVPRTRRRDVSATGHFVSLVLRSAVPVV